MRRALGIGFFLFSVSAHTQTLSVPSYRFDSEPVMGPKVMVVAKVQNTGSGRLAGWACLRLYDKDGFEIKSALSQEVNIAPGDVESVTVTSYMNDNLVHQVRESRLYVAKYGCADAPSAALTNVRIARFVSK